MSRTASEMVELGTVAPAFELLDVLSGHALKRDDLFAGNRKQSELRGPNNLPERRLGLLVMFVCVHCPYVKHLEAELANLGRDYAGPNGPIALVAIQSNDTVAYPQDGPDGMREQAARLGWNFPYLLDQSQGVARNYGAACTPDFFLFDGELKLVYRGQLDSSRPRRGDYGNEEPVTGSDLRAALDAVVAGIRPSPDQRASIGCNIKWKELEKA